MVKNWGITIGINKYHTLSSLKYAMTDADAVCQFFRQELNFNEVFNFTDESDPIAQDYGRDLDSRPTFKTLEGFFRKRFEKPFLDTGDNLWFFFAGHGIRHEDRDYLMPSDCDCGNIERYAISLNYISERLRRSGADNVILLIDACRNTIDGSRDSSGFGLEKQQGVITLFACCPEEKSYEIEELQQGAFTYALLESLRLEGEGNCATVERLFKRLRDTVPQLAHKYQKGAQNPSGVIEPPSKNHLILLPRKATLTDVMTLKVDALTAEVKGNPDEAKKFWTRVLVHSLADSDAISGIERLSRANMLPEPPPSPEPPPPPPDKNITRRRVIQTMGAAGCGLGLFLLGKATAQPDSPPSLGSKVKFNTLLVNAKGEVISQKTNSSQIFREKIGSVNLELMPISGGSFLMGSSEGEGENDEKPQHKVTIKSFLMSRYLVTQAQWKVVAALLPKADKALELAPSSFKGDNLPVENVSWDDAVEFCKRLSLYSKREYRLPSEAEWEYACRAGTTTPFYFGETLTSELANYNATVTYGDGPEGEYRERTTEVGSFPANAFGLYDMHGNVWEWCQDHWHENYQGAPEDGSAWITGGDASSRLLRGGSWPYNPAVCRSADRNWVARGYRNPYVGFRVVCASS